MISPIVRRASSEQKVIFDGKVKKSIPNKNPKGAVTSDEQ